MEKKEFVCKFCNKKFPSGKSLGGHIRIHSPRSSLDFIGEHNNNNNKKRSVDQREITPPLKQQQCRVCRKRFSSLKALANHMDCHNYEVGEKMMVMDTHQSASETTTSSDPEIVHGAKDLMFLHLSKKDYNFAEILETKLSSGELLLKTKDKVAVVDDDDDNGSSDDHYLMDGPKKSESDGSLRNTRVGSGFNSFSYGDELRNKEGGSKDELSKSKRVSPSSEIDSCADANSKIHRSSDDDGMAKKASGANKNTKVHECQICFKVYSSGQALGGHKRAHATIANEEERIKHKAADDDMQFDLNLPAEDNDE